MRLTRRSAALGALAFGVAGPALARGAGVPFYVGTNATGEGVGISRITLDPATGALSDVRLMAATASPANIFRHPARPVLYAATGDGGLLDGQNQLQAFRLGGATATLIGAVRCGGVTPVLGMVDAQRGFVATTNYRTDNLCIVRLNPDGTFASGPLLQPIAGGRDLKPHHVVPSPDGRFAIVPLIGGDRCDVFRLEGADFTPHGSARAPAGLGPRHAAFHPNGRWMFTSDEPGSAVSSYAWDASKGRLEHRASTSATTAPFPGNRPSHVRVHPNGRWLYVANRGRGTITTFAIDPATGAPTLTAESPFGKSAWHFEIAGGWMLVADMAGGKLVVMRIDPATGAPTLTDVSATMRAPTSLARA